MQGHRPEPTDRRPLVPLFDPFLPILSAVALMMAGAALLPWSSGAALADAPAAVAEPAAVADPVRAELIEAFRTDFTGGTVPLSDAVGEVREFTLEVHRVEREIAPGVEVEQWAFAFPGEAPTVPGPEIRVTEGDLVRITLRNTHDQPHSIHPHGITSNAVEGDGVHATSHIMVMPGQEYTYEFVAMQPGTHAYHCHVQTNLHLDMGMYGAIVVEPADEEATSWDVEYSLLLDEWDSAQDPSAPVHVSRPDHFLVNGKAFPATENLAVEEGQIALLRITNMGYQPHALHLHGMSFLVIAKDGYDLPRPYRGDTLPVLPGERYDLLVKGRDGTFPLHDHVVDNATNGGAYPGGMLTLVTGGEARRTSTDPASVHYGREGLPTPIAAAPATEGEAIGHHEGHAHHEGDGHAYDHADPAAHGVESPADEPSSEPAEVASGHVEVGITGFAFERPTLRVRKGTTVTWTNLDAAPHTVTAGVPGGRAAERAFDSTGEAEGGMEMMEQGDSWSYTFDQAGTFDYYCLPHPFMTATVIVEE